MVFSSVVFLVYFLPFFFLLYHFADRKYKNYILLAGSILFYAWGGPQFIYLILLSCALNFWLVYKMDALPKGRLRLTFFWLSITLNVGLLLYFKYANFFIDNINLLLSTWGGNSISWTKIVLPIGISFFTFQSLTYTVDVYQKKHAPLKKLSNYILYIICFPQLIAGPIVRFNEIADQITERTENNVLRINGFIRFCIGLSKKVIIANTMGEFADPIMNSNVDLLNSSQAWLGILAYTFQIYFDFSGYSDMAIGLGLMMGFQFPENFNNPYISTSITEFWRRWHITLGRWMRDYLYIPLGGNRASTSRMYFNLIFVFTVSGFWHGASWSFILWGLYHGFFLILDRLFLIKLLNKSGKLISTLFTFLVVIIGWVFFRIEDIGQAFQFIQCMFSFNFGFTGELNLYTKLIFGLALFFSFFTSIKPFLNFEQLVFKRDAQKTTQLTVGVILSLVFFIFCLSLITTSSFNPFIYFRF